MSMKNLCFHIGYSVLGGVDYGSEISLINLCRELSKFYNIVVFSLNLPEKEKIIDGFLVHRNAVFFEEYIKNNVVDFLVISRYLNPFLYHDLSHHNVKKIILWSHDVGFQSAFEGKQMRDMGKHFLKNIEDKISTIVCLTDFHADFMKRYYETKISFKTIGHGVNEMNDNSINKVKHRFIYTSYPNRGLDLLLKIFPLIRQEFPDSELHIYRDESTFSETQNEVIEMCKDYIKKKGFVDNKEILKAFAEAEVWLYPTNFAETYCISALEAQANGCLCITSPCGSLNEIIGDRGVLINAEYGSKEYIERVLKTVRIFFNSTLYENKINRAKSWARSQTYEMITRKWREEIFD